LLLLYCPLFSNWPVLHCVYLFKETSYIEIKCLAQYSAPSSYVVLMSITQIAAFDSTAVAYAIAWRSPNTALYRCQ